MTPVEPIPGMEAGIKNDGRGDPNYETLLRTFVNVAMYLQHNNNETFHIKII
jgi:hypothetical protein